MPSGWIVEVVDVARYIRDREFSVPVDVLLDTLLLQAAEEGFGNRVVPAIALPAHARLESIGMAEATPGVASVLSSLVRTDDRAARTPRTNGHQDGIQHELATDRWPR